MYAAEVVWTEKVYDSAKDKIVTKIRSNVKAFAIQAQAIKYIDTIEKQIEDGAESVTFRLGKVYYIEEVEE